MSRAVTAAVEAAIENNELYRVASRLTIYKSRVFFEAANLTDNTPDFVHPLAETGDYIAEAFSHCEYGFVTAVVAPDGSLYLMKSTSSIPVDTGINTDIRCRPGIYGNKVFCYVSGAWRKLTFDTDLAITANVAFSDFDQLGSIYPTSESDAFLCFVDDGGVGIGLSLNGANAVYCPGRLINPTYVYTTAGTGRDLYALHFAGAAAIASGRFFYFSHYDGSVKCVKFSNGMFSDFEVSIPSDLSTARIGNVFAYNNIVHMCFRFERSEEFASSTKYTLLAQSKDGVTFGLDQRVLVSLVDYRFLAAFDSATEQIAFSASNRFYITDAPYQVVQENAPSVAVELVSLEGGTSEMTAVLKSGAEEYYDNAVIIEGAFARIETGVQSSDGDVGILQPNGSTAYFKFIPYHDVVVAKIDKNWADGERSMTLQLVPDGLWHTSVMSHPFYMEIQGKQSVHDPTEVMDNLYKFSGENGIEWALSADFWQDDNTPLGSQFHGPSQTTDHWSRDLEDILVNYPVLGDDATFPMRLYGWSRAGIPDVVPNVADPTPTNAPNDTFYGLVELIQSSGEVQQVVTTLGELASTYSNPVQTYFAEGIRAGSEPIIYNLTNPGEGKKIKRLGIRVVSSGFGATTYVVERVEMPTIAVQFQVEPVADEQPFSVSDVTSSWNLVDQLTLQVTIDNAINGNEVEMNYQPQAGLLYAVAIVGDVAFTRGGIDYLQDAHFVAQIASSADPYAPLAWSRSYPPGTGPTANPSVKITFDEWPYFYPQGQITRDDVVRDIVPDSNHAYLMHWSDTRLHDSTVQASYIPYFYATGSNKHKVALFLEGTGDISNIQRGEFTVYVFEIPVEYPYAELLFALRQDTFSTPPWGASHWDPKPTGGMTHLLTTNSFKIGNVPDPNGEIEMTVCNGTADWVPMTIRAKFSIVANDSHVSHNLWCKITYTNTPPFTEQLVFLNAEPFEGLSGTYEETFYLNLPPDTSPEDPSADSQFHIKLWIPSSEAYLTSTYREVEVTSGDMSTVLVPAPVTIPSFTLPVVNVTLNGGIGGHIATNKKGIPQIAFSTRPYSAYNFECIGRFTFRGVYSKVGLIGLASDKDNFMLGYARQGYIGIAKVRNGVSETITELAMEDECREDQMFNLRFWHRDGRLGVEVKKVPDYWPMRGSQVLYNWDGDVDGVLTVLDDLYHVGVYGLINPPKIRTTGFRSKGTVLGVMPLDLDPDTVASGISAFPSSGQFDIGGKIYNYTGKNTGVTVPRGPFHLLSHGTWAGTFNTDQLGYTYPANPAVEFTFFRWWDGATHAADYANAIVASSEGYAWVHDLTNWRSWVSASGEVAYLRNRSRWYSDTLPSYYATDTEKVWVTNGMTGITPVVVEDLEYFHPAGAFAFVHSDDSILLHGFAAFSGEKDNSIMDLLDRFCRVANTLADPTGDVVIASAALTDGGEVAIE